MNKFCVFCGNKPEDKTKEHIIPRWLIEYTGDPNRKISLGYDSKKKCIRRFAFKSLTLPACKKCNNDFGNLEERVKPVLMNILEKDKLKKDDISILLDWFDKVRIGLWLLYYSLDENNMDIIPKFHIEQRIGKRDRMLIIYKEHHNNKNNVQKGIGFYGVNTEAFQLVPSCFSLRINEYCFFNVSKEFLFSRRIGFPYPLKKGAEYVRELDGVRFDISEGIKRNMLPLIRKNKFIPGIELYQPMFSPIIKNEEYFSMYNNNEYVKQNSLDFKNGIGKVFKYDRHSNKLLENIEIDMNEAEIDMDIGTSIARQTFEFQNYILKLDDPGWYKNITKELVEIYQNKRKAALMMNEVYSELAITKDIQNIDIEKLKKKYIR